MSQVVRVSLEELIPSNHIYRKFNTLWDFKNVEKQLKEIEKDNNYKGYGAFEIIQMFIITIYGRSI